MDGGFPLRVDRPSNSRHAGPERPTFFKTSKDAQQPVESGMKAFNSGTSELTLNGTTVMRVHEQNHATIHAHDENETWDRRPDNFSRVALMIEIGQPR